MEGTQGASPCQGSALMQANPGGGGLCSEEAPLSAAPGFRPAAEPRGCVFVGLECLRQCPSSVPGRPLGFSIGLPGTVDPPRLTQANAG